MIINLNDIPENKRVCFGGYVNGWLTQGGLEPIFVDTKGFHYLRSEKLKKLLKNVPFDVKVFLALDGYKEVDDE